MAIRQLLRAWVAAICMVAAAAAPVAAEAPTASAAPALSIRVGQAADFSHVEFHWSGGARMSVKRDGQVMTVRFNRDARPDLSTLTLVPLKWLKSADARHDGGVISFVLTLTDDADASTGQADGADYVNIFARKTAQAADAPQPTQLPSPTRPDPVPAGGTLTMKATTTDTQLRLDFPWRNPAGAAVFRRGDATWIVFDAAAKIDLSKAPKSDPHYAAIQTFTGPSYSVVRIVSGEPEAAVAESDGSDWAVTLQPVNQPAFTQVKLVRDDTDGPATMTAAVAGASGLFWIDDPAVGDKLAVVTALGPAKGVAGQRDYVEFSVLDSAQGLAVAPRTDDLSVSYSGDIVSIGRPKGLTLSPMSATDKIAAASFASPRPAIIPGLIGDDWANLGGAGFVARYDALLAPVSDEEAKGLEAPTSAHLAMARFLIGEALSFEAIGVLDNSFKTHPALGGEPEFRALRGMARAMAGRYKEAETDLAVPALDDNPAASLWRGYVFAKLSQWPDAHREFANGSKALMQFPALWRARFAREAAETALALGDANGAQSWINFALSAQVDPDEQARSALVQAQVVEKQGDTAGALAKYQALEQSPLDAVAGPAVLHATQIQLSLGQITPTQAVSAYDGLRYRWRGGAFELETIRALGQLYLSQGRYREALEALRSAGQQLPDLPEAVQLQADLAAAFRSLFLDGQADGLQPIQALALFYDFKELTPVGADGDAMVRRLTRRLVDVDLLPQAEELLKYQVDNRLDGVPKAQVATDLAVIDLMDHKPEDALDAINASRTTALPQAFNLQRRIITARALVGLGQYDGALEMLGNDTSPDATDVRAEAVWKEKAWPQAGALFEKMLGDRWKTPGPMSSVQEGQLLRAAVAYSLAGDDAALARLRGQYAGFVDGARNPDALRVALAGFDVGKVSLADFTRVAADNQTFEGWVAKMKDRFRQAAPPAPHVASALNQTPGAGLASPAGKAAATGRG